LQLDDVLFTSYRRQLVELAARNQLPVMYAFRGFVDAGGLMAYGVDLPDHYRRAATYVDKILKGAKPADLPFSNPQSSNSSSISNPPRRSVSPSHRRSSPAWTS